MGEWVGFLVRVAAGVGEWVGFLVKVAAGVGKRVFSCVTVTFGETVMVGETTLSNRDGMVSVGYPAVCMGSDGVIGTDIEPVAHPMTVILTRASSVLCTREITINVTVNFLSSDRIFLYG